MATPQEIAEAFSGPGYTITADEVEHWLRNGWNPTPLAIIDANAQGLPVPLVDDHEDAQEPKSTGCAWVWVLGEDGNGGYRVPAQVARLMKRMQQELNEVKRAAAAALREHRAELAAALGTPEPDVTPQEPGVDSSTL